MVTLEQIKEMIIKKDENIEKALFDYFNKTKKSDNYIKKLKSQIEEKLNQKDLSSAKNILGEYKKVANDDISIYSIEGIISIQENDLEKAFDIFSDGLKKDPTNVDLLYNMGQLGAIVGDNEVIVHYYNECLKYTNDLNLIKELELILNGLYDDKKSDIMTIITVGLKQSEASLFDRNNNVINIVENENLEDEEIYLENGITTYKVNPNKTTRIIEYLISENKNCILVFKSINCRDLIQKFKHKVKVIYYANKNYYTEKVNYYTNSVNVFLEKLICDEVDIIITDNIKIYNYKLIVEDRNNIHFLDEKLKDRFNINYLIEKINYVNRKDINNKLKEYSKVVIDEYEKMYCKLAIEENIYDCLKISKNIYEQYNTEESYHIYIYILNKIKKYSELVEVALQSQYCGEVFKAELVYLKKNNNSNLLNFITNLSIKNYKMIEVNFNSQNSLYKLAAYNFELSKRDEALIKYTEMLKEINIFSESPMVNRNIFHLLYLKADRDYKKYENIYNELIKNRK